MGPKKTKNQLRREKAKLKKSQPQPEQPIKQEAVPDVEVKREVDDYEHFVDDHDGQVAEQEDTAVDDVREALENPLYAEYKQIFEKFSAEEKTDEKEKREMYYSDDSDGHEMDDEGEEDIKPAFSRRKIKNLRKIPLSQLKANAPRPELVDWFDADAPDPDLLIQMKSVRGAVPVPDHWQYKREYLASKRGPRRRHFQLPEFIRATGIMEMRDVLKEDDRSLAQKSRERVMPKMGTLDLDFGKVRDAFFKHQTKPKMYMLGDVYYEGRESQRTDEWWKYRPGEDNMTDELRHALNIPPGAPPPWLVNMQRHGPPPSYPGLKIRGLNAPPPPGADWGYQAGGWGRPPLGADGRPIWADQYAVVKSTFAKHSDNQTTWGEMVDDESESEEDVGEIEEDDDEEESDEDMGAAPQYVEEEQESTPKKHQLEDVAPEPSNGQASTGRKRRRFDGDSSVPSREETERKVDDLINSVRGSY